MKNQNDLLADSDTERYFFQLSAESYTGELSTFQSGLIEAIHDNSEPFFNPETKASHRSTVGLSAPKFGLLEEYVAVEFTSDLAFRIRFAKKHPAEYIGDIIHCVSSDKIALTDFHMSEVIQQFREEDIAVSEILPVPVDCPEARFKRDRRTERRTENERLSNQSMFNISDEHQEIVILPVEEPLPAFNRIKPGGKRYGINIRMDSDGIAPKLGWYTVFGLSTQGSTVPILPVLENTNKFHDFIDPHN